MKHCCLLMTIMLVGCLPEAIVDPASCKVDPVLEGIWLAKGFQLTQFKHDDVEYGPGTQQTIFLVSAFDERCYLVTKLDYYSAEDGRLGIFGSGHTGALTQWRTWLAPIGDRQYLICRQIKPAIPLDQDVTRSWRNFLPTFEVERDGNMDVTLKPVMFPDILQRLGEPISAEEYTRRLAEFPPNEIIARIKSAPDAATPDDPRPITVRRMEAATAPHVQRVLEAFQIINPHNRPAQLMPPRDDRGTSAIE